MWRCGLLSEIRAAGRSPCLLPVDHPCDELAGHRRRRRPALGNPGAHPPLRDPVAGPGDKTQLGFAVVDTGRHRQRVFRNTFTTMKRFLERGWLDVPIAARCFELSVLTLTDTARDAINLQLAKYLHRRLAEPLLRLGIGQGAPLPFAIRVHVVPGMLDVIPDGSSQKG